MKGDFAKRTDICKGKSVVNVDMLLKHAAIHSRVSSQNWWYSSWEMRVRGGARGGVSSVWRHQCQSQSHSQGVRLERNKCLRRILNFHTIIFLGSLIWHTHFNNVTYFVKVKIECCLPVLFQGLGVCCCCGAVCLGKGWGGAHTSGLAQVSVSSSSSSS